MVEKCLIMFQGKGRDATIAAIKDEKVLCEGTCTVFCLSLNNVMVAHPYDKDCEA